MAEPTGKRKTNILKDQESEKVAEAPVSKKTPKKVTEPRKPFVINERVKRVLGALLIFFAVYLLLAFGTFLVNWFNEITDDIFGDFPIANVLRGEDRGVKNSTGNFGAMLSQLLVKEGFGAGAFYLVVLLLNWGIRMVVGFRLLTPWRNWRLAILSLAWLPLLLAFSFPDDPLNVLGGAVGMFLVKYLTGLLGSVGVIFALAFVFLAFLIATFNLSFLFAPKSVNTDEKSRKNADKLAEDKYNTVEYSVEDVADNVFGREVKPVSKNDLILDSDTIDLDPDTTFEAPLPDTGKEVELSVVKPAGEEVKTKGPIERQGLDTKFDPTLDLPDYIFPPLDLLNEYGDGKITVDRTELEANKNRIVETLGNYSIGIERIKATIGPTVTLYEIVPSAGVRISRIKGLEDDIALSLSAMGIRIIAPIPGKGTVGIEVPNLKPEIVSMRSIIGSDRFRLSNYELPFGLGKTIANESYVADLTKMPHILMAGATGQGKSVGLNAIITSLLYCKHPSELKFVMVDPKKVELSLFSRIERHYLAKLPDSEEAIITDTRKVVRTLNSLSIEMDERYDLLKDAQVRNIKEYNIKFRERRLVPRGDVKHRFLPYFVLVVDEFADLIMTAGKEIEGPITRLAQLARAVGIHLIIATQRPSVNIITGTIKANFPARLAFRVISRIDSRTILDTGGADQLVGRGDMLLSTGNDIVRLQCAFIDTPEVERLTDFIGSQRGYPDAYHLPEFSEEQDEINDVYDASDRDELFEDAARMIVQHQQGSTSLLQRKLKLGYNRAGRIIDQLEAAGIVGPFEGSKAREVRVANEMALEQFLKDLDSKNHNND
ncbi:MAG: DNA translocase FtsK [Bacteroidales bacterium]|nr:DNA translocase FtsK [Bacteroidales bacterium]